MKTIAIAILACVFVVSCSHLDSYKTTLGRFRARYAQAKTEVQKRTVCIDLIDAGVLYRGSRIEDLKWVFQQDFEEMGENDASNRLAIVHFVPPRKSLNPMASDFVTGWYLSLTYRVDGAVVHYSLSDDSKDKSARMLHERQVREGRSDSDPGLPPVN